MLLIRYAKGKQKWVANNSTEYMYIRPSRGHNQPSYGGLETAPHRKEKKGVFL